MENCKSSTEQEFQEMRNQIAILNHKLEQESIISEKLLRDVMKRKANVINANAWICIAASIFLIIFAPLEFPQVGLSYPFIAATIVLMLVLVFVTWHQHININRKTMNGNLVTVAQVMKKLKQSYLNGFKYSIMGLLFWGAWLITELILRSDNPKEGLIRTIGGIVGIVIGVFIGLHTHKSVVNNADDIIKQIEEA